MTTFLDRAAGACAGDAFLAAMFADMASYPPKGIGQKHGYVILDPVEGECPTVTASRILNSPTSSQELGPTAKAGCLPAGNGEYLFFGWARPS